MKLQIADPSAGSGQVFRLRNVLKKLPDNSGVYLFFGGDRELLYVGKATSLRDRVRSYFSHPLRPSADSPSGRGRYPTRPVEQMLHEVADIKWRETDSVLEAIILEANYIKKFQPKYNVEGKDDKSWNYLAITHEEYSRVVPIRQHELDSLKHKNIKTLKQFLYMFGPYPGLNTAVTLKLLRRLFNFSDCQKRRKNRRRADPSISLAHARSTQDDVYRPCLYRQLGQCLGVCTGEITSAKYKQRVIQPLILFLRGKKKRLIKNLELRMKQAAKAEQFEEAARLRNQIAALQRIQDVALLNKSFVQDNLKPITYNLTPRRIEGYDISNLGPTGVVGSMVVFTNGEPDKSQYRKFKIKSFVGQSDVGALAEVLTRRLRHGDVKGQLSNVQGQMFYWPLPDLFLIDGGRPQVNRARRVLREFGVERPIVGIAKGPERKKNEFIYERTTNITNWIDNNRSLLIRVRDEAHRFAVAYQRKLRRLR